MPPRVFTIAPGAPFLATFAESFLDGKIIPGLGRDSGPLALAKAKIYVPTRRAGRALAAELALRGKTSAMLLPKSWPSARSTAKAGRPVSTTRSIRIFRAPWEK